MMMIENPHPQTHLVFDPELTGIFLDTVATLCNRECCLPKDEELAKIFEPSIRILQAINTDELIGRD